MSTLTKVLERNIKVIEKNADLTEGRFRLGHHLMPPVGSMIRMDYAGIKADIMCFFNTLPLMWKVD